MTTERIIKRPMLSAPAGIRLELGGLVEDRMVRNIQQWLLSAPQANPAMLQIFRDRDRLPRRDLVSWAGEFAGKYLTSAVLALRMSENPQLRDQVAHFVRDLVATQDEDGYMGPAPQAERLTGKVVAGYELWDVWGHYHCMLGLLLWHQDTGDSAALAACLKAADLLCNRFLEGDEKVASAGMHEMNMAVAHVLCLLYQHTGVQRYLLLAQSIEKEWELAPAGDYVRTALEGLEFYQTPKPRWESLHDIQAIAELYYITGDEKYRKAFEHIWWSIAKGDRHNTGGFSSGEAAVGNPYDPRAIETCCTIAWVALSIDMLRMTGNPLIADEIELATYNGVLGAQHPSGRWWTYNTPMDGVRKASAHEIVFQSREGSPDLNCCSVNGPRGLGMIAEWALMQGEDGVALNYYGAGVTRCALPSGNKLTLMQTTDYPLKGAVSIRVSLEQKASFAIRLRIPAWSKHTQVTVNCVKCDGVVAGQYLSIQREWQTGDEVHVELDMTPHVWVGEREAEGKVSVYVGPLLLAYDRQFNVMDPHEIPVVDADSLKQMTIAENTNAIQPWVLYRVPVAGASDLFLCDFTSAGSAGTPYCSWLPARGFTPGEFSREVPVWCVSA
jgi:uncharacterized protein